MKFVHTQLRGAIGILTLDRPKVNALNKELIEGLTIALQEMNRQGIRAVVLRAKPGVNVFSAGHEVTELPTNGRDPLTYDDPLRQVVRAIQLHPVL